MTQNDPTDNALAAIASILDHKEISEPKASEPKASEPKASEPKAFESKGLEIQGFEFKDDTSKDDDPATIHTTEIFTVVKEVKQTVTVTAVSHPETLIEEHESPATAPEPTDVDGYSRPGPGPLDAIRFRWTARRDENGQYFVDETIGSSSRPISSGPMPRDEVVQFIDDREQAARHRFDELKSSMTLGHRDDVDRPH